MKMYFKTCIFILVLSVLNLAASQSECFENEIFTTVVNPCNSCGIRGWCPQETGVPGCECSPGYFRNSDGICVPPEACDTPPTDAIANRDIEERVPRCGPNEQFTSCGSACPPTCDNPRPGPCTLQCVSGCFCRKDYLRKDGKCVPKFQCHPVPSPEPSAPPTGIVPRSSHEGPPPVYPPVRLPAIPPPPPFFKPPLPPGIVPRDSHDRPPPPYFKPPLPPGIIPRDSHDRPPPPPPPYFKPPLHPGIVPRDSHDRPPPLPPYIKSPLPPGIVPRSSHDRPVYPPAYPRPPIYRPPPPFFPPPPPPPRPVFPPPPRPVFPPPPRPPTVRPPRPPPLRPDSRGCPLRSKCDRYCRSVGFVIGFCVGENFLTCNCLR